MIRRNGFRLEKAFKSKRLRGKHQAFNDFPTQFHSNYQWLDVISHSNAIYLDKVLLTMKPTVRVIDDYVTARPLTLIFKCNVGKGKFLVSRNDLLSDKEKQT